jgi:large subunit ribosomal protein L31
MRAGIHPEYHIVTVKCSCGNTFETASTIKGKSLNVEVCSSCHPFYTGKQKLVDTAGKVNKFKDRFGAFSLQTAAKTTKNQENRDQK